MQNILVICGVKNSGKTTLIEKIIPVLTGKGLKVAVVKHDGHDFNCDVPGTDSYRMTMAGACGTAVWSSNRFFVHKKVQGTELEQMRDMFPEADIILVEGCKNSEYPKIEVVRAGISSEPVSNPAGRFLIVSDIDREWGEESASFDEVERIVENIMNVRSLEKVSAVILAGGQSRRMGIDKAFLECEGKTFLDRQIDKLRMLGITDILVSGWGEGMIPDEVPKQGPLGGIMTALKHISNSAAVILPVDAVLIEPETIRKLVSHHGDKPITIAVSGDRREYLIGVFDASVITEIESLLASDRRAVSALIDKVGCEEVIFDGHEREFMNINTPEDYKSLMER